MKTDCIAVVLAAGKGTRMKNRIYPKCCMRRQASLWRHGLWMQRER